MEETDVCYPTPTLRFLHQAIPNGCPAKALEPSQRLTLGVQALAGTQTITDLADEFGVSRKFVYQQAATAQTALKVAFTPAEASEDKVLFHLPVTKAWLRQVALGLTMICHSSYRGVHEFCRDLLDVSMSVATVHNILSDAMDKARPYNSQQNLANIGIAALDEIFQIRQPVLVGVDVRSLYCFLLSREDHRDGDTWGVHLLDLQQRGFAPRATIADFGSGLRAGQKLAMPEVLCYGDVFHALYEISPVVSYLENRAYDAIAVQHKLEQKKAKTKRQGGRTQALGRKAALARQQEGKAIALADDIVLLERWLRCDVLAVSALPYADRCALYDFIVAQLNERAPLCPHRIGPVCKLLQNHRDDLLAFAAQLDHDLMVLAAQFEIDVDIVRQMFDLQRLEPRQPLRWQREAALRQKLRHSQFQALSAAVQDLAERIIRASSAIENFNSRLRPYFFLRRDLGPDYLHLLRFFLNHRRFLRSEYPERVDKSPTELLTGQTHPHWLEMLGYKRFQRCSAN
jgi:hypothetical protein